MSPPEGAFSPMPFYFTFPSAASPLLHKSVLLCQSHGLFQAFKNARNFRLSLAALSYSKRLAVKQGLKGITLVDIKKSKLNDSMIAIGNIKSVLFVGLVLVLSACVCFVAEVSTKTHFSRCLR